MQVNKQKCNSIVCICCYSRWRVSFSCVSHRQLHHHHRCGLQDPNGWHRRRASEAADLGHSRPGEIPNHHINVTIINVLDFESGGTSETLFQFVSPSTGTTETPTVSLLFMMWPIQSPLSMWRDGWMKSPRTAITSVRSWVSRRFKELQIFL